MPNFDVVSEVNLNEAANAVDQANREAGQRYDFKGAEPKYERNEGEITMSCKEEFHLEPMLQILQAKLAKRGVDLACLQVGEKHIAGSQARQPVTLRQGIEADLARKIVKHIKDSKLKVQVAIQQQQVRVTGKKRDDLQQVIALLKEEDFGLPLQYINFRDVLDDLGGHERRVSCQHRRADQAALDRSVPTAVTLLAHFPASPYHHRP